PPEVPGHRLDTVIGSGGSSVVWSGRDVMGRPVAIKVPHTRLDPVSLEQATTERHVLMAVEHEHLVRLRDVVPLPDGRIALVFDLVTGAPLSSLVARRGHLRPGEVVTVLTPLCHAVTALHSAGGVHADISPGNVMISEGGRPQLLDLGAARVLTTAPGAVYGTSGFVAPEVRRGSLPDARSDVFSLGALAWFCATGNGAPDTDQRLDPEIVSSHVGDALASVVAACIDPDPARRPDGATLARLFYDATRAEPIEVVVGGDDAAALTHRLRVQAAGDPPIHRPVPGRWSRVLGRKRPPASDAGRNAVGVGDRSSADGNATVREPFSVGATSLRSLPAPLLMALAAAVVLLGGAAVVRSVSAGSATTSSPASTVTAASSAGSAQRASGVNPRATPPPDRAAGATTAGSATRLTAGATAPPADVRADRQAPAKSTEALVAALSKTRAEALTQQNRAGLGQVHRTQSPSWAADEKLIDTLSAQHVRWESLRPSVESARLVETAGAHAVVRATVGWAPYEVVSADGARQQRSAESGRTLDFSLVWLPQGWRLESLSEPRRSEPTPSEPTPSAPRAS
ncbi:MAG: serine/threonine-protein kinase, partial [Terracoccus sp.]